MASTYSDIVSDLDQQELASSTKLFGKSKCHDKDTLTTMELGEQAITINTDSEFNLDAALTPSCRRNAAATY